MYVFRHYRRKPILTIISFESGRTTAAQFSRNMQKRKGDSVFTSPWLTRLAEGAAGSAACFGGQSTRVVRRSGLFHSQLIYTCKHTYNLTYRHAYIHTYTYRSHIQTYPHYRHAACMHSRIHVNIYLCKHTCIRTWTYTLHIRAARTASARVVTGQGSSMPRI